jgi:four helix bundle protein
MANIAEGFGRKGKIEFIRFLTIAQASCVELRSHLYIALDLNYLAEGRFHELFALATRVENLIGGLIRHLRTS